MKLYLENFVFFLKHFTAFHILRRVNQINSELVSQIAVLLLHNKCRPGYEKHEAQAGSQSVSRSPLLQKEKFLIIITRAMKQLSSNSIIRGTWGNNNST